MGRKPVPAPPPPTARRPSRGGADAGPTGRQWRHQQKEQQHVYNWKKVTTLQWMKDFRDSFTKFQYPFKPICKCFFWSFGYYPDMVSKESLQRYVSKHPIQHRKLSTVDDAAAGYTAGLAVDTPVASATPSEKGMFDGKGGDTTDTSVASEDGGKKSKKKKKKGKDDDTTSVASSADSEATSYDEEGKKKKKKKKKKGGDDGDDTQSVSTVGGESKKGKKKKKKGGDGEGDDTVSVSTAGGESKGGKKKKKKRTDDDGDDTQSVSTAGESEAGSKKKKKKKKK